MSKQCFGRASWSTSVSIGASTIRNVNGPAKVYMNMRSQLAYLIDNVIFLGSNSVEK